MGPKMFLRRRIKSLLVLDPSHSTANCMHNAIEYLPAAQPSRNRLNGLGALGADEAQKQQLGAFLQVRLMHSCRIVIS